MENVVNWANSSMSFSCSKKTTKILLLFVLVFAIIGSALTSICVSNFNNSTVPSIGTIKTIGVAAYSDPHLKTEIKSIDWGLIWVGNDNDEIYYLKNISNYKVSLIFNVTNWNPKNIANYIHLSWNYSRKSLNPGEVVPVKFSLASPYSDSFLNYLISNSIKNFNCTVNIFASKL